MVNCPECLEKGESAKLVDLGWTVNGLNYFCPRCEKCFPDSVAE